MPGARVGVNDAVSTSTPYWSCKTTSHGLISPRARANGGNGIDVTLQNASFDAVMEWLVALHDNYGIDVETASLIPAREPGIVNGSLLLRRL